MPERYETGIRLLKELIILIGKDPKMTRRAIMLHLEEIIAFLERGGVTE